MKIQKAFQFELMPNGAERCAFARFAGVARKAWNLALNQPKYLGYAQNCKLLADWKVEFPFMREAHSQILQQKLKDLDKGFKASFGTPRPAA